MEKLAKLLCSRTVDRIEHEGASTTENTTEADILQDAERMKNVRCTQSVIHDRQSGVFDHLKQLISANGFYIPSNQPSKCPQGLGRLLLIQTRSKNQILHCERASSLEKPVGFTENVFLMKSGLQTKHPKGVHKPSLVPPQSGIKGVGNNEPIASIYSRLRREGPFGTSWSLVEKAQLGKRPRIECYPTL